MSVSSRPHSTGSLTSISISDRMSDGTSARNSMANPPLTTTLSTIAMQSGITRIVIALLQSREKLELKILEMNPLLTYLGSTAKEAESMLVHHDDVLLKLQSKQSPVEELLKQADQLIATQRPRGEVYAAMADSLGLAWKDLNFQLEERRTLIYLNLAFFKAYEDCFGRVLELEKDPQVTDFNNPRDSLGKMKGKRAQMLSSLVKTLEAGQDLLGKIEEIGNNSDCDSRPLKTKSEAEFAKSQVEGWLEKLHDRRRILDDGLKTQREKMEEKIELDELGRKVEKLKEEIGDVVVRKHFGMDKGETEVELKAVDSTLITIMTLQESALHMTRIIESKRFKHWPTFPLKSSAFHYLDVLNTLVDTFENYKEDLNYTIQFFDLAQSAHKKLDELDKSEVLDDLSKFKKKLNEVTYGALSKGEILLDKFGWDDERTKGIRRSHDELIKRRDGMKKFEENLYITAVLSEYLEEFNIVFAATVEIEGWKNCEAELGTTRSEAESLRDATKEAIGRLKTATNRLRRFSLADEIKNELNEESAADLAIKTQGLNKSTKELEECLYLRLVVIEHFITFLIKAEEINETLRSGRRINSPSLEALENVAGKFIDSTQQCGGLQTVPAEVALRQMMADIGKKVIEVEKEAAINARRDSLLETIQSLGKRVKDLRKEAFPILPDNAAGTDATSTVSHVKIAKMNNLETAKKLQKDIEKTLPRIEGIDEGKNLKDECEIVSNFIVNYETLCMMLVHLYESLSGLEERINESFMYGKLTLKEISSAEKSHTVEHQMAVQEFKAAEDYAIDIVALMKETEPPLAASIDESRLLGSVAGRSAGWDKFSRSQKGTLDDMRASLLNHDFLQISSKLKDLLNHLTQSRGQYGETFRTSMEISEAFSRFETTLTTVREKIEEFVEAAKEAKGDEDILEKKFELESRFSSLEQQTKERRRVIDLTLTYFTLSNDARGWLEEGLSLAKEGMEVKKRGKSQNALLLQNEILEFLSKGEDLQIERIKRVAQISSQLYGEEKSKTNEEMIRGENSRMIQELKDVSANLLVPQPEEAKFPILEITESITTGEPEILMEERVKVEEGIPSTVLAGECKLTRVLTPSISPSRQLVEKETQFEAIEVTPSVKIDRDVNTQTVEKSSEASTQAEESTETIQEVLTIVDGTIAPAFVTPLNDVAITEGQRLSLQCKVVGVPKPKISWLKDGMEIQGISDYKTEFDGSICSLTIEETFMPDSSIFTCRAENEGGMAETSGKLVVAESQSNLSPPHFESKLPPNVTFKEASRGNRLECFVSGNPLPTVFWFRDGYSIDDSPDYVITFNNGKCIVNFDDVNLTHKGDYACRAVNRLGADETYSTVTVEVLEVERPFVVVPLCNVMARAGEKVVLLCELGGNPSSIEWFHDDRRIEFSPGVEKSLNISAPSLTIKEAFPKHAGSYRLIARNAAGEVSSFSTLTVKGRLPNETSDSDFEKSDLEVSRPKIQSPLRNTIVKEGDGFLLECIIVGNPEPEVIWYHNGEPIKESKDFQLKFQGDKCRLIVKEAFLEDGGDYRVNAINSAGEASSTCSVSVVEKEKMTEGPKFSKLIEDTMVDQGSEVVMSCKLSEGWPKPVVTWYKNAVEIKDSDGYEICTGADDEYFLKIPVAQPNHRGNYMVKAKNTGGEAKAFASLIVKVETGLFKEKEESESMTVTVMTSKRTIVHNESSSSIQQIEKTSSIEEEDRTKSYEEKKALFERKSSNDGDIIVPSIIKVTRNKVGPRFISPINSLMVDEGTFVVLEGTVDGYPEPTLSWTKNDFRIDDTIPCNFCHGKVTLQIGKVKVKDGGRYACVAENSAGVATSVADLIVKKTTFPPVFGKRLQTQTVAPKKRIYMEVEVTGTPAPTITWFKDGRKVEPGGKIEIRSEGNRHVFILSDARAINSGQYMVKAANDVGDAQSIADITVLDDDLAFSLQQPTKVIFESTLGKSEELGTKEVSVVYQMKQFGNSPKLERPSTPKSTEFPKISVTPSEKSRRPSWDQEPELVPEPPPIICYTPKPDSIPQKKFSVKAKAKTFENVQVTDVPGGVRILPPPSPPAVSISVPPFKPIASDVQGEFQHSSDFKISSFEASEFVKSSEMERNASRIESSSPVFPKTPTSTPAPTPEQNYNIDFEENPLLPPPPEFREELGGRPKSLPLIKPSKFIPGEFKESDYESDFDAKIEPKWRPKSVTEPQISSPRPLFQTSSLPIENECFEESTNDNVKSEVCDEQEEKRMKVKDLAKMWTREIELSYEASSSTSTRTEYKKEETKLVAAAVSPGLSRLSPIVFQEGAQEEKKKEITKMKNVWPPPPSEDSGVESPSKTFESPKQTFGSPSKTFGTPSKVFDSPSKQTFGSPTKVFESPSKPQVESPSKHKIESPKQQKSSFARVSTFEKMSQGSFKNVAGQGVSNCMMKPKPEKKVSDFSPTQSQVSQGVQIAKSPFKPDTSPKTPSSPMRTSSNVESPGKSKDVQYYVSTVVGPTSNAAAGGLREEMEVVSTRTMTEVSSSTFTSTTSTEGGGEGVKWPPWTSSTSKLSPKPAVPPKPSKGVSKTPSPINLPSDNRQQEDLLKPGTPPEFRFSPRPKSNAGEASFDFETCPWIVIPSPGSGDIVKPEVFVPPKGRPSWACKEMKKIVPSKFVPGEVSESDYGSDAEEFRVRPIWAPMESESEDDTKRFRPVKPPQTHQQSSLSMNLDAMGEYMSERAERSNRAFVRDIQPLVKDSSQQPPRDGGNSGVVYFKYDFGYEFGLLAPQVGDADETSEGTPIPVTHMSHTHQAPK